ncbi:amidohydrolase family protein [Paenibacillus sp. UNC451MF]|uniref:amidohydrolase family protein n=1 Tax=Paenibacillus sp. UNC451MF TaxID=1449063 RepID=UPI00048CC168|nr:amidohydrolase family protein [Paenibacillus sp. UNC451MF]
MNLQVIVFPQDGICACPDNEERLEEALRLGADGVGAIPHCEHSWERSHMTGREELEEVLRMVTIRGAKTLQIEDSYGLEVGNQASFVLLPAVDTAELLCRQAACRYVISHGQVIAETIPARTVLTESLWFQEERHSLLHKGSKGSGSR